jgi:undecaprenyl-diphosphatase
MLFDIDVWLLYAVNSGLANPLCDWFFPILTNAKWLWWPIYALGLAWMCFKGGRRGIVYAISLVLAVAILDPLSHNFLKETIDRVRPYDALGGVRQIIHSGGGSFPSNHAMNNMAAAVILAAYAPRYRWLWFGIAALIAFARVYEGVHYPSDVLGGALIGIIGGWVLTKAVKRFV